MAKKIKYLKDWLLTIAAVLVGLLAVSADGFSDLATKKFWWNFWSVVHVLSIVAFIGGWLYLKIREKRNNF
jgi:uncharacterized membrane protein